MSKRSKPATLFGVDGLASAIAFDDIPTESDKPVRTDHQVFPDVTLFRPYKADLPIAFDASFRTAVIKSFNESGLQPQIDFNHASAYGLSQDSCAAAGWVVALTDKGEDGLYATIEWTAIGLNAIRAKEYQYLSPEFALSQFDKAKGVYTAQPRLYAIALTNRPFLENQDRLAASEPASKELIMTNELEELQAALAVEQAEKKKLTDELSLVRKEDAIKTQALADIRTKQSQALVDAAQKEGRVTPAMLSGVTEYAVLCADNFDKLQTFLSSLPVQVQPAQRGSASVAATETVLTKDQRDAITLEANSHFDFTDAQLKTCGEWESIDIKGMVTFSDGTKKHINDVRKAGGLI